MALPAIMRRLFAGDGYGPLLKDDIVSKRISIQDWSSAFDYQPATAVRGSDGKPYWSVAASGPNSGGAANPVNDDGSHWVSLPSMADIAAMNYATQGWVAGQGYATQAWVGGQNYAARPSLFDNGGAGSKLQPGVIPFAASSASSSVNDVASTRWVRDFVGYTTIYVDYGNGSDSNDGLSSGSRVKTIGHALAIARRHVGDKHFISLSNGAPYSEDVTIDSLNVVFSLEGDVTINGKITATDANVAVVGNGFRLIFTSRSTMSGSLAKVYHSRVDFNCNIQTNLANGTLEHLFYADMSSLLVFTGNVLIGTSVDLANAFVADACSSILILNNTVTVANDNKLAAFINIQHSSSIKCIGCELNANTKNFFAFAESASSIYFSRCNFATVISKTVVAVSGTSFVYFADGCYGYLQAKADGYCILPSNNSCAKMSNVAITLKANTSSAIRSFIRIDGCSRVTVDSSTIVLTGTVNISNVNVSACSSLHVPSGDAEGANNIGKSNTTGKPSCIVAYNSVAYTTNNSTLFGDNAPDVRDNSLYY